MMENRKLLARSMINKWRSAFDLGTPMDNHLFMWICFECGHGKIAESKVFQVCRCLNFMTLEQIPEGKVFELLL